MCGEEKCERDKIKDTKDRKKESRKERKNIYRTIQYIGDRISKRTRESMREEKGWGEAEKQTGKK